MPRDFNLILVGTGGQGVIMASNILGWAALKYNNKNQVRTAETHGMAQRGGTVIVHLRIGTKVESPLVKIKNADVILSFELVEAVRYIDYLKPNGILLVNNEIIIPPVLFRGQHVIADPEACIGCGNCQINCHVNKYYADHNTLAVITTPSSHVVNGRCEILSGCTGCMNCIDICNKNALRLIKEISYPPFKEIEQLITATSANGFILPASLIAKQIGDIRMTNMVMIGALLGFDDLPISISSVEDAMLQILRPNLVEANMKALEAGREAILKRRDS
ncbi:MAG: 2-oxoacid:acceptor oxidoreductase family protein [Candidatus Helarchaeota archaeon]